MTTPAHTLWEVSITERLYRVGWFWLVLLTLSLPWDLFQRIPFTPTTISKVGGGVVILTAAAIVAIRRKMHRTGLEWPIGAFGVACAIATVISEDHDVSLAMFLRYVGHLALFYGVFVCARNTAFARTSLTAYCLAAIGVAVLSIVCKAGFLLPADWLPTVVPYSGRLIDVAASGASMRMAAASPDLNQGALLLLIAFALACHRSFRSGYLWVSLQAIALALLFVAILVTQSRSALLAAGLIVSCCVVRQVLRLPKRMLIITLPVLLVATIVLTLALYEPIREWTMRADQSASSRMETYRAAIRAVPDHLMIGTGLDVSDVMLAKLPEGHAISGQTIHSVPLKIVLETGLIGLFAYLWLWGVLGIRTWRSLVRAAGPRERDLGATLLQVGFAVLCMQMLQPVTALPHYPVLLGLWCAALPTYTPDSPTTLVPQRWKYAYLAVAAVAITVLVAANEYTYQRQAQRVATIADSLDAAVAFERSGRWNEALEQYTNTLPLIEGKNGDRPVNQFQFIDVLSNVIDLPSTQAEMNVLYAKPALDVICRFGIARTEATTGNPERAADEFRLILDRQPSFAQAHFALADQYWGAGDYERGIHEYESAAQWSHDWCNLQFRFQMDRWDARIVALEQSEKNSDLLERAYILRKRGRWDEAAILYRALYARIPESAEAGYYVAVDAALRGENDVAENLWKQIVERAASAYPEAQTALSR